MNRKYHVKLTDRERKEIQEVLNEAHTAAIMRDLKLEEAVLYINQPPCGPKTNYPQGCQYVLPNMLPEDAILRVVGPGGYDQIFIGLPDVFK